MVDVVDQVTDACQGLRLDDLHECPHEILKNRLKGCTACLPGHPSDLRRVGHNRNPTFRKLGRVHARMEDCLSHVRMSLIKSTFDAHLSPGCGEQLVDHCRAPRRLENSQATLMGCGCGRISTTRLDALQQRLRWSGFGGALACAPQHFTARKGCSTRDSDSRGNRRPLPALRNNLLGSLTVRGAALGHATHGRPPAVTAGLRGLPRRFVGAS